MQEGSSRSRHRGCGEPAQSLGDGLRAPQAPSTALGIYCVCSCFPFLVQRDGISSELRVTTAAAGLARGSSRAALDLWGSETLRKAECWSHIP